LFTGITILETLWQKESESEVHFYRENHYMVQSMLFVLGVLLRDGKIKGRYA